MPQIVYDLKGYPHLAYTIQDFAERKARKQPNINQLANLLIRSIFEDGGLGRVLSIDEVTPGTPANGWTIRFTGETNGRTADPYIATYDGEVISYNDDFSRRPRDLSEGLALALEFAAKKGQKTCNKGKPCGGSCIAKGRNCLKDKKDLTKNQQQATDAIAKSESEKPKKNIEKRPKTKGDASASLKASDWNPDAIPDLTVRDFRDYLDKKRLTTEPPTGTFAETKKLWEEFPALGRGQALTREKYDILIANDIAAGYVPSDAALTDAKLTKAQLKQVEANRKQHEQWKKELEPIDRALNYSMADEKADRDWKPQMTEKEAEAYISDSFFGSMNWYHGNRQEITQSIATEGAQPELNRRGLYGQGVYFGIDKSIGEEYAAAGVGEVEVITARIRAKKPYITTSEEFDRIPDMLNESEMSMYLRARGYDSVYLQDLGYGIAYDTKQVVTTTRENVTDRKSELALKLKNKYQPGGHANKWKQTRNAQALAAVDPVVTDRDRLLQSQNAMQQ